MGKTIAIIDDSLTMRQQVTITLGEAGYTVVEAEDGQKGLALLRSLGARLSMAICDVNMPHMNGLELVAEVKKDPAFAALPIVMLTTENQPELLKLATQAGAKAWLVKPFTPAVLVAAARKLAGQP